MSLWQGDKMIAGMPNMDKAKAEMQVQYDEFSENVNNQLKNMNEQLGEIDALLDSIIGGE